MDYPRTNTESFNRLLALHKLGKANVVDWHCAVGKNHVYPSHFATWCTKQVNKENVILTNDVYCLCAKLVKYFDDFISAKTEPKNITPSRLISYITKPMSGYAAAMQRNLRDGALREIGFINGNTVAEPFRGAECITQIK